MTSETAAAGLQPVLAELRQMRETMATKADLAGFATKADLAGFATKADLAGFATKADLAGFATKAELRAEVRQIRETMATKADLAGFATKADLAGFATKVDLADLKGYLAEREVRLIKWTVGAMLGLMAILVGFLVGVVPLVT